MDNNHAAAGGDWTVGLRAVPQRLHQSTRFWFGDFRGFLFKQNMLSMAIGIIIGSATNTVVTKINADILMPLVNLFFRNQQWKTLGPVISRYQAESGHWVDNRLLVGDLIFAFANLLAVGLICYFLTKLLLKPAPAPPVAPAPPTRQCPFCLESLPAQARKCKFCCSELPAQAATA